MKHMPLKSEVRAGTCRDHIKPEAEGVDLYFSTPTVRQEAETGDSLEAPGPAALNHQWCSTETCLSCAHMVFSHTFT